MRNSQIDHTFTSLKEFTHSRLLARNIFFNMLGQVAPFFAALLALPRIIDALGTDRFGILSIAWIMLGYFSIFDLGLGRAITKLVGEKLGAQNKSDIPGIVWTGFLLALLTGIIVALIVVLILPMLTFRLINIPAEIQGETFKAFLVLVLTIPLITSSASMRGLLEAYQRFGAINIIRTINGIYIYLMPLLVIQYTRSLVVISTTLAIGRIVLWVIHLVFSLYTITIKKENIVLQTGLARKLLKLGGWMSISNFISPIMMYFDRFFIGAWLSVAAVGYYAASFEVVTKVMLVSAAFARVLFPAFSTGYGGKTKNVNKLYINSIRLLGYILFPITIVVIIYANPGIDHWLGPVFAEKGAVVMQLLAIGVFFNAPGQIAFALVQAGGRADLTAKLHLAEVPVYLLVLWYTVNHFGIAGAAFTWALRLLLDTIILLCFAKNLNKKVRMGRTSVLLILTLFVFIGSLLLESLVNRNLLLLAGTNVFIFYNWMILRKKGLFVRE
jgi:O-antigen/teichoic acid export membrane protein